MEFKLTAQETALLAAFRAFASGVPTDDDMRILRGGQYIDESAGTIRLSIKGEKEFDDLRSLERMEEESRAAWPIIKDLQRASDEARDASIDMWRMRRQLDELLQSLQVMKTDANSDRIDALRKQIDDKANLAFKLCIEYFRTDATVSLRATPSLTPKRRGSQ